ncbi:MAG: filamentous hemagglutinin family protein [Paucibacter sp.]|nr:filamentous hemagglutinin family protein [Roseateles sp.]
MKNDLSNHDVVELAKVFFANLIETGSLVQKDSNGNPINSSLKFFDTAIASLFPNAVSTAGDNISLFGSQLKTEQGGDITMYAPAGSMYAGLTLGYPNKPPSDQGIFTIQGGMISAFVAQDIHVNLGRIFTLDGGDIVLVSQYGSIDAGNGSKTATSAPPPVITIDANGHVQVDFSSSINGSGVATFQTNPDIPGGNVYAVAPRGAFDAGDAGVRSAGSVEIVANVVLNSNNISAVGSVTGALAPVATPSVPAAAPANVTTSKDDDVVKAATGASTGSNNLTVTVESLGFGEDCDDTTPDCASDNADPKKRKKAPEKN